MVIHHVAHRVAWEAARRRGIYRVASLDREGFIHCSECHQVPRVVRTFFSGEDELVVLCIETTRLGSKVLYEPGADVGEMFPHVYGPIDLHAVVKVVALS